jgi:hypothetical protein
MSDKTYQTLFYCFITFLTIYPVIELFTKKYHCAIKVLIVIGIILFWGVALKVKSIDDNDKAASTKREAHLAGVIDSINAKMTIIEHKKDSLANVINNIDSHNTYKNNFPNLKVATFGSH